MRRCLLFALVAGCLAPASGTDGAVADASSPFDAAVDASPAPDLMPLCDPVAQTGCTQGQKCTFHPQVGRWSLTCAPVEGMLGVSAACVTSGPDYHDACGPGLFCFAGYEPDLICRPLCHADTDCSETLDHCLTMILGKPPNGFCIASCRPFAGDCPNGRNCSRIYQDADGSGIFTNCHPPGPKPAGAACIGIDDCAADTVCWGAVCRALCDGAHPCAQGNCTPLPLPNGVGYCG